MCLMKYRPSALNIAMLSIHSSPIGDLGTQDTGGMSVYVRELARALGRRGHRIDIFTQPDDRRHDAVVDLYENVRIIHLKGKTNKKIAKSSLYAALPQFFHDLESFRTQQDIKYDVIHSHYWLSGVLGAKARSWWDAPHIFTFHTIGAVKKQACAEENEPDVRMSNEKKLARLCDRIIVPTQKEKNDLVHFYDASQKKIQVIPCGVNLDRFKPLEKKSARRRLSIQIEDPIVLYVGRYTPVKGLDRLLEAFRFIQHRPPVRLIMVGGDGEHSPMFQRLLSEAKALNIRNHLTFAGRIDQKKLPLYYSAADVLVVPSYYESFGLVALEALACGTPVVTAPVGGMEMIVKDGVTGYVASVPGAKHFARLIKTVLSKQQTNDFSPAQVRASVTGFTWERSSSKMLEAYRAAAIR